MPKRILAGLLLAAVLLPTLALATEKVTSFHSDITVNADGSLLVTEDIDIHSEGDKIVHGIQRDFPVRFKDFTGAQRTTSFALTAVQRDFHDEPYSLVPIDNGVRVRIGSADTKLKPGDYKYKLSYRTENQLTSLAKGDLLYWNVTGNDWDFPIDEASATVHFPKTLKPSDVTVEGFTGIAGSKTSACTQELRDGVLNCKTTAALPKGWGYTITAIFPAGLATVTAGTSTAPGVNGTAPASAGSAPPSGSSPLSSGSASPGPGAAPGSGSGSTSMPWYGWLFLPVILLLGVFRSGCSGCSGCLGGGGFPGGGWGNRGGGGWFGGGGSGGGGFGGGGSSGGGGGGGGGGFGGGSSGGGGGGGGGSGW